MLRRWAGDREGDLPPPALEPNAVDAFDQQAFDTIVAASGLMPPYHHRLGGKRSMADGALRPAVPGMPPMPVEVPAPCREASDRLTRLGGSKGADLLRLDGTAARVPRRPSLPLMRVGVGVGLEPSTFQMRSAGPGRVRRPRSAGTGAGAGTNTNNGESLERTKRLGTKRSLLGMFKKGQQGGSEVGVGDVTVPLPLPAVSTLASASHMPAAIGAPTTVASPPESLSLSPSPSPSPPELSPVSSIPPQSQSHTSAARRTRAGSEGALLSYHDYDHPTAAASAVALHQRYLAGRCRESDSPPPPRCEADAEAKTGPSVERERDGMTVPTGDLESYAKPLVAHISSTSTPVSKPGSAGGGPIANANSRRPGPDGGTGYRYAPARLRESRSVSSLRGRRPSFGSGSGFGTGERDRERERERERERGVLESVPSPSRVVPPLPTTSLGTSQWVSGPRCGRTASDAPFSKSALRHPSESDLGVRAPPRLSCDLRVCPPLSLSSSLSAREHDHDHDHDHEDPPALASPSTLSSFEDALPQSPMYAAFSDETASSIGVGVCGLDVSSSHAQAMALLAKAQRDVYVSADTDADAANGEADDLHTPLIDQLAALGEISAMERRFAQGRKQQQQQLVPVPMPVPVPVWRPVESDCDDRVRTNGSDSGLAEHRKDGGVSGVRKCSIPRATKMRRPHTAEGTTMRRRAQGDCFFLLWSARSHRVVPTLARSRQQTGRVSTSEGPPCTVPLSVCHVARQLPTNTSRRRQR